MSEDTPLNNPVTSDELLDVLKKIINIPERVASITITCTVGCYPVVQCVYYPEKQGHYVKEKYKLVTIDDDEADENIPHWEEVKQE